MEVFQAILFSLTLSTLLLWYLQTCLKAENEKLTTKTPKNQNQNQYPWSKECCELKSAVHVLLSRFYLDFILILSKFYPDKIRIKIGHGWACCAKSIWWVIRMLLCCSSKYFVKNKLHRVIVSCGFHRCKFGSCRFFSLKKEYKPIPGCTHKF